MILVTFPGPFLAPCPTGHAAYATAGQTVSVHLGLAAPRDVCHDGTSGPGPPEPSWTPAGRSRRSRSRPDHKEWHVAVDADGAVTAAPGSASLDGQAGSRVETVQLLTPE